jgi:ribonucleoside-diphosphate reductase subunit M1
MLNSEISLSSFGWCVTQGVPLESHPTKLMGSKGFQNRFFDFEKLGEITELVTRNLNRIIDVNYYPVETAKRSNLRHRPIGIGVQGLADAFILLGMPFDSTEVIVICVRMCERERNPSGNW